MNAAGTYRGYLWLALAAALAARPEPGLAASLVLDEPPPAEQLGKLDASLWALKRDVGSKGLGATAFTAKGLGLVSDGPRVVVEIAIGKDTAETLRQLEASGARIEAEEGGFVSASVQPGDLDRIAAIPSVERVLTPVWGTVKAAAGASAASIGEGSLHKRGITGAGVRVGVLDSGFAGVARFGGPGVSVHGAHGTEVHGTACIEVVRRIAPGAEIHATPLVMRAEAKPTSLSDVELITHVAFRRALRDLIDRRMDVITSSIGFDAAGPGDGRGAISKLVEEAAAKAVFVQAAGNEGESQYRGTFTDADGNGFHEFAAAGTRIVGAEDGIEVEVRPSGKIRFRPEELLPLDLFQGGAIVHLAWDDWAPDPERPRPVQDLDLIVLVPAESKVFASMEVQDGRTMAFPMERRTVRLESPQSKGRPGAYAVIRRRAGSGPIGLQIVATKARVWATHRSQATSLTIPADSKGALTVGACEIGEAGVAAYSSRGPTTDGRAKPELAAPAGVKVASYAVPFSGTSAATPHVAGALALLKQVHPDWGPDRLRSGIKRLVRPIGGGPNDAGAGLLDLSGLTVNPPVGTPPRPPRPPTPVPAATEERPLRIALHTEPPDADIVLHFTHPDSRDCWRGQAEPVWGGSWRENPRMLVSGSDQELEVMDLKAPGVFLIWAHCRHAGPGGKARARLTITGSDGQPHELGEELATGEVWSPFGIRISGLGPDAELVPREGLTKRMPPDPVGLGELWIERTRGGASAEVSPVEPVRAGDRIRLGLKPRTGVYAYLAGAAAGGRAQLYWPSRKGGARLAAGGALAIPDGQSLEVDGAAASERLALVLSREPLADVEALLSGGTGPTVLDDILRGAPAWDDTLMLLRPPGGTAPGRTVLHAPAESGVQWIVLRLAVAR